MNLQGDMSEYLRTGPLLHSAFLLAGKCTGVFINTSKPSIRGLYAFGSLGRLHNLLFDLDCIKLYNDRYGIYPSCTVEGKKLYPFHTGNDTVSNATLSFLIDEKQDLRFHPENNTFEIRDQFLFGEGSREASAVLPLFAITVDNDTVRLKVRFPENAEDAALHIPWYPLYDSFTSDGLQRPIEYYRNGFCGTYPKWQPFLSLRDRCQGPDR